MPSRSAIAACRSVTCGGCDRFAAAGQIARLRLDKHAAQLAARRRAREDRRRQHRRTRRFAGRLAAAYSITHPPRRTANSSERRAIGSRIKIGGVWHRWIPAVETKYSRRCRAQSVRSHFGVNFFRIREANLRCRLEGSGARMAQAREFSGSHCWLAGLHPMRFFTESMLLQLLPIASRIAICHKIRLLQPRQVRDQHANLQPGQAI